MTKIKMCGLSRRSDIAAANELKIDYIGFVFAPRSRRAVSPEQAEELKRLLDPEILAVGVFVNEEAEVIAGLLEKGIIDVAQLHGTEDEAYIQRLKKLTSCPVIRAFQIRSAGEAARAEECCADGILFDSGAGSGAVLDWELIRAVKRPYFLAGGLNPENVGDAIRTLHPEAVDVSSGIETEGHKDFSKMAAFAAAVRKENGR